MIEKVMILNNINPDTLASIVKERKKQIDMWGNQSHPPEVWMVIAQEEFGEVAQAIQKNHFGWGKEADKGNLYEELIQTISVLISFAEDIKK